MADTQLQQLVINELTKAQYEAITPESNQLYMVTDEDYLEPSDIATSITAASTNAQVAGAKAVYDYVASSQEIFWCTYGETTYAEIIAAVNAGKLPVCIDEDKKLTFSMYNANGAYFGNTYSAKYAKHASVSSANVWAHGSRTFENAGNKVTSISASSTDTEYPSAKAVYDAIQSGGGTDPNAVHYTAETKTAEEKEQARTNIGAGTSNLAIGTTASTAAAGNHTHNYAGSSSAGGAATSANKVNAALTFSNGGSGAASGTTFDGSTARTISYNSIGAAASSHSHAFGDLTSRPSYAGVTMTGSTAIPEVKTAAWDSKSVVSGVASDGNWTSITINGTTNNIPAGGGGSQHLYRHNIKITDDYDLNIYFILYTADSSAYTTFSAVKSKMIPIFKYPASGYNGIGGIYHAVQHENDEFFFAYYFMIECDELTEDYEEVEWAGCSISDTVQTVF